MDKGRIPARPRDAAVVGLPGQVCECAEAGAFLELWDQTLRKEVSIPRFRPPGRFQQHVQKAPRRPAYLDERALEAAGGHLLPGDVLACLLLCGPLRESARAFRVAPPVTRPVGRVRGGGLGAEKRVRADTGRDAGPRHALRLQRRYAPHGRRLGGSGSVHGRAAGGGGTGVRDGLRHLPSNWRLCECHPRHRRPLAQQDQAPLPNQAGRLRRILQVKRFT
mmetsp:Transcript_12189/g.43075  ORF Transcript_12189/g.43075 Transcript_12189/m.43075 type:complete len:221 (+) Transcript_12189:627-1289(+)